MATPDWLERYDEDAGFLIVPKCLLQCKGITKSAAIVYAAIAAEDDDADDVVCVKQSKIVKITGYSRRQVISAIESLIREDLLEPEPDRTGRSNIYRLTHRITPRRKQKKQKPDEPEGVSTDNTSYRNFAREG